MKTVSGKITSTETISLSKAAKVLSNFVAAETGASQAVSTYLCRASAAFNELVQFHKALKASKSGCKLKKHAQESTHSEAPRKHAQKPEENEVGCNVNDGGGSHGARKKHKKKKRNENVERDGGDSTVIEEGNRKERKRKRKSAEVDDEEIIVFSEECSLKKKKRRRKIEDED